jgi:hypothetical protein
MKPSHFLFAPVLACLLAGCCSSPNLDFVLEPRRVTIRTQPEGADVVQLRALQQSPVVLGTTPLENIVVTVMEDVHLAHVDAANSRDMMRHAGTLVLRVSKPGYQTKEVVLRTEAEGLVEHEIVLQPEP